MTYFLPKTLTLRVLGRKKKNKKKKKHETRIDKDVLKFPSCFLLSMVLGGRLYSIIQELFGYSRLKRGSLQRFQIIYVNTIDISLKF